MVFHFWFGQDKYSQQTREREREIRGERSSGVLPSAMIVLWMPVSIVFSQYRSRIPDATFTEAITSCRSSEQRSLLNHDDRVGCFQENSVVAVQQKIIMRKHIYCHDGPFVVRVCTCFWSFFNFDQSWIAPFLPFSYDTPSKSSRLSTPLDQMLGIISRDARGVNNVVAE